MKGEFVFEGISGIPGMRFASGLWFMLKLTGLDERVLSEFLQGGYVKCQEYGLKRIEMAIFDPEMAWNGLNSLKWLKMAQNDKKTLKRPKIASPLTKTVIFP